jgi:hypothetical protein
MQTDGCSFSFLSDNLISADHAGFYAAFPPGISSMSYGDIYLLGSEFYFDDIIYWATHGFDKSLANLLQCNQTPQQTGRTTACTTGQCSWSRQPRT